MRDVAIVLALLACGCALWAVVGSIRMGSWLSQHGVKVHWILFRGLMPWYVHRYQAMTKGIDGRTGPLLPHFVIPINLALLFGVAAVIVLAAARAR